MNCNDCCRHPTCIDRLYHLEYCSYYMDSGVSIGMEIELVPCFFEYCECRRHGLAVICICFMFVTHDSTSDSDYYP